MHSDKRSEEEKEEESERSVFVHREEMSSKLQEPQGDGRHTRTHSHILSTHILLNGP